MNKIASPSRLFLYTSAETGIIAAETMTRLYILVFYVSAGLDPALAGIAMTLAIGVDAISDPLMGRIIDRFQSNVGRRRIFFIPGSILFTLSFLALFTPVPQGGVLLFLWLLISYIGVNLGMTILAIPHLALTVDMASNNYERSKAFAFKYFFSVFGMLIGTGVPGYLLTQEITDPHHKSAAVLGLLIMMTATLAFLSSKGFDKPTIKKNKVQDSLITMIKKPWFILVTLSWVLSSIGQTINSAAALYYYRLFLKLPEDQTQIILFTFMLTVCLSLPVWVIMSKMRSKAHMIAVSILLLGITGSVAYPLFPPEVMLWPLIYGIFGGILIGSVALLEPFLSERLIADGIHNFGIYFGIWKMSGKIARAIGVGLTGLAFSWIGWDENTQVLLHPDRLAYLFGPWVGAFFAVSAILLWFVTKTSDKDSSP
ncbi:MAG: hypothetical protein CMP10_20680 [Zetaproteobacteria bacterium]|nr:hypothetical protein [Pseudobdellovibrionaceae bacterium]